MKSEATLRNIAEVVLGGVMTNLSVQPPAWTWLELPLYIPVIWGTLRLAEKMRGTPGPSGGVA